MVLAAGIALWWIARGRRRRSTTSSTSCADLLGSNDFTFLSWRLLRGVTLLGLVIVCLSTVITVLAAAFYNLFAELIGGIEITVVEEDDRR